MTRLAYDLGGWGNISFAGDQPLTAEQITKEADTFTSARLWDPRPLRTTLDQLQTVRKYYDFTGVDTDRYVINGVKRQVMLSARELALEQNPNASGWVNQRIRFTHGVGAAMVPVNEVGSEGQPRLLISNLPPVSSDWRAHRSTRPARGSTSASARARTSSSAPSRTSSTTRPARATPKARSGPRRAGRGRPASPSTTR